MIPKILLASVACVVVLAGFALLSSAGQRLAPGLIQFVSRHQSLVVLLALLAVVLVVAVLARRARSMRDPP